MSDTNAYPYATYLDIKFPALATVDVPALVKVETASIVPTGDA